MFKFSCPEEKLFDDFIKVKVQLTWCPGADSNHRHADFQSAALPTELPGR